MVDVGVYAGKTGAIAVMYESCKRQFYLLFSHFYMYLLYWSYIPFYVVGLSYV